MSERLLCLRCHITVYDLDSNAHAKCSQCGHIDHPERMKEFEDTVYLVCGATGEGPDYTQWNVCAYRDYDIAHGLVRELRVEYNRLHKSYGAPGHANRVRRTGVDCIEINGKPVETSLLTLDPNICIDYTGVWWSVVSIELRTPK